MLSERLAWLWLADQWRHAVDGYVVIRREGYLTLQSVRCHGLCASVEAMRKYKKITMDTSRMMRAKLAVIPHGRGENHLYCWSHSPSGNRARIRFCEKMAERLERGKT